MPYAAVITGTEHVLADLAPSFSSAIAKIRKREGEMDSRVLALRTLRI
jgi:hypothetical protein